MSRRSRRAAAPVSSSASTTIRPLLMCRPPANRSIEETSALRQQVLVTLVLASSALTCAVIAMRPILPRPLRERARRWPDRHPRPRTLCRRSHDPRIAHRQVSRGRVGDASARGQVGHHQRAPRTRDRSVLDVRAGRRPCSRRRAPRRSADRERARPAPRGRSAEVKPSVSPGCGARLSVQHPGAVSLRAPRAARGPAGAGSRWCTRSPDRARPSRRLGSRRPPPGRRGGSAGSSATDAHLPGVVATSTCPRTVVSSSGSRRVERRAPRRRCRAG